MEKPEVVTITGWHASDQLFDHPNRLDSMVQRTVDSSRHANGALGTWVTLSQDPQYGHARYGKHLYEFTMMLDPHQILRYPVSRLHMMSHSHFEVSSRGEAEAPYLELRDKWLASSFKFVTLSEYSGVCALGIILDVFAINTWRCLK